QYARVGGLTALCAVPFFYQIATLYAESRGHLKIDYFLLQRTMLDKLALAAPLNAAVAHIAYTGPLHTSIVLTLATLLFFLGGLGVRWAGVGGVLRDAWSPSAGFWRVLAWIVIAGVAIPFVIVTDPYHDTLQFYQTALFILWAFAARAVIEWHVPPRCRALLVTVVIGLAIPSSIHYVVEKSGDGPNHPLVRIGPSELAVANYLGTLNPDTTVLLHDRPLDPSLLVIASERRAVLAWARYVTGSETRRREVDRFFASADREPKVAFDVLRQYRVTHVVERPSRDRIHPEVVRRLRLVIRFPDLVLYEVPADIFG